MARVWGEGKETNWWSAGEFEGSETVISCDTVMVDTFVQTHRQNVQHPERYSCKLWTLVNNNVSILTPDYSEHVTVTPDVGRAKPRGRGSVQKFTFGSISLYA